MLCSSLLASQLPFHYSEMGSRYCVKAGILTVLRCVLLKPEDGPPLKNKPLVGDLFNIILF